MRPDPTFWADRLVCVTGGGGFLGFHLVRQLCQLGARVRVLGLRPAPAHPLWHMPKVDLRVADVCDAGAVEQTLAGASVVIHTAGLVASWGPALARMRRVHEEGTRNVLAAAARTAGARVVHTSSIVTVGAGRRADEVLDEDGAFNLAGLDVAYVRAKRAAEQVALSAPGDVVVVNPAYLVGPEDHEPSVMGRFCRRFWKGRVPLAFPGGFNLVDVRDAATGHLLAAERGQSRRRYILGGENHTQVSFLRMLADVAGYRPRSLFRIPGWLLRGTAQGAEWLARWTGREPYPSLEQARLCGHHWFYRSDRARRELGYAPRPVRETLAEAFAWHRQSEPWRLRGLNAWWMRAAG